MAVIYLRSSDGSDASDGLTWANAKATLAAALTAAGAGGTVYVSDNHAESQGSAQTLTSPGTAASPTTIICVDDTSDPEPPTAIATGATVTTTSGGQNFNGFAYSNGVDYFNSATGAATAIIGNGAAGYWIFENGSVNLSASSGTATISIGAVGAGSDDLGMELRNSDLGFGAVGQSVLVRAPLNWYGGAVTGTAPTTLFIPPSAGNTAPMNAYGVDLSLLDSGNNLVSASAANFGIYHFHNCKLGSSVAVTTGSVAGQGGVRTLVVNSDSADTNFRFVKNVYQGEITQETTIVRTGGASDGTTGFSRKMVSSANAKFYSPLVFGDTEEPLLVWNETTGSAVTLTVETVTDNVTLTDAEAWIEVEYLGTSGFPIASFASDRAADILATPANQTSSSETWTTTGLTTPIKQALSKAVTPAEKGWIAVRVMLAKASTTMYFCPKVTVA